VNIGFPLTIFILEWAARLVLALGAEAKSDVPASAEYAHPFMKTLEDSLVSIHHLETI
jgi:histidinol phosphatase-like PHP family hydrolase